MFVQLKGFSLRRGSNLHLEEEAFHHLGSEGGNECLLGNLIASEIEWKDRKRSLQRCLSVLAHGEDLGCV